MVHDSGRLPRRFAWLAVVLFATTPLVIRAMTTGAPLLSLLPFVIVWLAAMLARGPMPNVWRDAAAGAALGLGLYAHASGVVTMPLLLMAGVVAMTQHPRGLPIGGAAVMVAAFVAVSAPLAITYLTTPQLLTEQVSRYALYDAGRFNVLQGAREMVSWVGLTARVEVYYDYFNPGLWFLQGGTLRSAFVRPEVFLPPLLLLVPAGILRLLTPGHSYESWLLLGGLAVAPVAPALTAQPPVPHRLLLATPFAAVIAAYGVVHLISAWTVWRRDAESRQPAHR